jgi:hypothetical protein
MKPRSEEDALKHAALLYVAAFMVLTRRDRFPETAVEFARKNLESASNALTASGYVPHLAAGIDVIRNGHVADVTFSGGPEAVPIIISGKDAAERSRITYPR